MAWSHLHLLSQVFSHFNFLRVLGISLGNFFCYDYPQALQVPIQEDTGVSTFVYAWLYSIYSLPNMGLPLFGGLLVDFLGVRFCTTLFSFILVIGQFISAVGGYYNNIYIMLAGRLIFGLGGENMTVVNVLPHLLLHFTLCF